MSAPESSEATTATPADDTTPAEGTAVEGETKRRGLKRSTKIGLAVIVVLAVLAAAAFTINYFVNSSKFVSTDNAQVDGTQNPDRGTGGRHPRRLARHHRRRPAA